MAFVTTSWQRDDLFWTRVVEAAKLHQQDSYCFFGDVQDDEDLTFSDDVLAKLLQNDAFSQEFFRGASSDVVQYFQAYSSDYCDQSTFLAIYWKGKVFCCHDEMDADSILRAESLAPWLKECSLRDVTFGTTPPLTISDFLEEVRDIAVSSPKEKLHPQRIVHLGLFLLTSKEDGLSACYDYIRTIPSLCRLTPLQYLI